MAKFQKVAQFGTDSELVMICDPMYLANEDNVKIINKEINKLTDDKTLPLKFPGGHYGLGVLADSGGKGSFSVYERTLKTGSKQILIKFE